MKKVLALLLSVLMLFGALSVGVTAMDIETVKQEVNINNNQAILSFKLNGGTIKGGVRVYTPSYVEAVKDADGKVIGTTTVPGSFNWVENYLDEMYYMIPESASAQVPGTTVKLPGVTPPSGYVFNGWYCVETNQTHPGNRMFVIPANTGNTVIEFIADYSLETPEEDEMAGVFDILVKVFGTIIGLLFLSDKEEGAVEAGMQLMESLLGSLFS